jgi:hypothetical protein
MSDMAATNRAVSRRSDQVEHRASLSDAIDLIHRGETVLTLLDPITVDADPHDANGQWLGARLAIGELPRLMLPPCDLRCAGVRHDPDHFVALTDLALDPASRRVGSWWAGWNETLEAMHQSGRVWYAGAPAMPVTPRGRRLFSATRLLRISTTDPRWVTYHDAPQETLYRVMNGQHRGDSVVAVTFGPSPLLPALAGALIAPDHPPARDPQIAIRMLAAGWAAVERGLPYEA